MFGRKKTLTTKTFLTKKYEHRKSIQPSSNMRIFSIRLIPSFRPISIKQFNLKIDDNSSFCNPAFLVVIMSTFELIKRKNYSKREICRKKKLVSLYWITQLIVRNKYKNNCFLPREPFYLIFFKKTPEKI